MIVGDLVKWILVNRRGKAFAGWSEEKIAATVFEAIRTGTLIYTADACGFTGVFIFFKLPEHKTAETGPILTTTREAVKQLAAYFYNQYPDWKLLIHDRKGGFSKVNDRKFIRRLFNRKI